VSKVATAWVERQPPGGMRAGWFAGGSPAVSHKDMMPRIFCVVWERRRLTSVEG
jgi:hypothetical protein